VEGEGVNRQGYGATFRIPLFPVYLCYLLCLSALPLLHCLLVLHGEIYDARRGGKRQDRVREKSYKIQN
jgi:hypothetical protein